MGVPPTVGRKSAVSHQCQRGPVLRSLAGAAALLLCLAASAAWAGDFGTLTWGMPVSKVASLYPWAVKRVQGDDVLFVLRDTVYAGRKATLGATVHRGQLDHVLVIFHSATPEDLLDLAAELEGQHGRPVKRSETSDGYPSYGWRLERTYLSLELQRTESAAASPGSRTTFDLHLSYLDIRSDKGQAQRPKQSEGRQ
jgi:hypothetical protein